MRQAMLAAGGIASAALALWLMSMAPLEAADSRGFALEDFKLKSRPGSPRHLHPGSGPAQLLGGPGVLLRLLPWRRRFSAGPGGGAGIQADCLPGRRRDGPRRRRRVRCLRARSSGGAEPAADGCGVPRGERAMALPVGPGSALERGEGVRLMLASVRPAGLSAAAVISGAWCWSPGSRRWRSAAAP